MYEKTRKSQRIASTNVLRVGAFDSVEENVHVSKNICSSGCQFESAFPYGIGKVLAMQILLLTHSIKPIGKVVWDKQISKGQYEIGVEFVLISPDDASSLEEFLSFGQPNMKTG